LISQSRSGINSYYHYDGHGSTRSLTNDNEIITDSYNYEAYGNILSKTGTTENNYLYSGEQFDSHLNQYYLRARYYNQNVGRFQNMDTWMGSDGNPLTLNKFNYTESNPVMKIDPSGNWSLTELMTSMAVGGIINTIAEWNPNATVGTHMQNFFMGALEGAVAYGILGVGMVAMSRFINFAKAARLTRMVNGVFSKLISSGTNYAGTMIPKFFQLSTRVGKIFVNPNATKHMAELLKSPSIVSKAVQGSASQTKLASSLILKEFQEAVKFAAKKGLVNQSVATGESVVVASNGMIWDFIFVAERNAGPGLAKIVLKHAQILAH